jgi:O-antigen/teichoic acid export membrane protein
MPVLLCAAAVDAVVSFLATVYLVRKKSMHSFVTAIAGTGLNLLLNALLIPSIGVLGAAVATLVSYCAVCVLRTLDVPRLLTFDRLIPRQLLNFGLLFGMAAVMTFVGRGRLLVAGSLGIAVLGVNFLDLWQGIKGILKRKV